mmetsp:Transcript_6597/g.7422  ORF Transcript_6597/g.7422 Transcript_6597/m.7422 type:complete len:304 (+) Transcript_6597:46-957(+)
MQAFDTSSFIDFSANPNFFNKEDALADDIFFKLSDPEWSFLDTALSSASTEVNGGISKESSDAKKTQQAKPNAVKFCERVANEILSILNNSQFCDKMAFSLYEIVKQIMSLADCKVTNHQFFNLYLTNIFLAVWKEKLELITNEADEEFDWKDIFSLESLPELLENITNNYDEVSSFIKFETAAGKEIFLSSYKKLLVACNVILVNEAVLKRMLCDQKLYEEISNLQDLALIANEYWLYNHYDQASEKFALESSELADKLNDARSRYERLVQSYGQLGIFNVQELGTEHFTMLFTFWTQILWI